MSKDSKALYYDAGGIETLDIIKAKLTPEQYKGRQIVIFLLTIINGT